MVTLQPAGDYSDEAQQVKLSAEVRLNSMGSCDAV
jgi:hypothetical protein